MANQDNKRALVIFRDADRVNPYRDALIAAGVEPILTAAAGEPTLDGFDGLVLTGGSDVDPKLYGQELGEQTDPPDPERDRIEWRLLRAALDRDMPVLAICRGMQLMNVFHGGTLRQHLEPVERHRRVAGSRAQPIHAVCIEPESLLARIAGRNTWDVNSRHHQAIEQVGQHLRVSARDLEDGMIEAVERPDKRFVLGVQWHPEDQVFELPEQLALFTEFGAACSSLVQR